MEVPKLVKGSYKKWCLQMKMLMSKHGVWDTVEERSDVKDMTAKENDMKNGAALFILYEALDDSDFEKVKKATTAKEAWNELAKAYGCGNRMKQIRQQDLKEERRSCSEGENAQRAKSEEEGSRSSGEETRGTETEGNSNCSEGS